MSVRAVGVLVVLAAACGPSDPCSTVRYGGQVCQPDAGMAAGQPLRLWVLESTCGSPCDREGPACEVTRAGPVLTLTLVRRSCPVTTFPTLVCAAACVPTGATCTLPALARGEYTLRSEGHADGALSVGTGSAVSCPDTQRD